MCHQLFQARFTIWLLLLAESARAEERYWPFECRGKVGGDRRSRRALTHSFPAIHHTPAGILMMNTATLLPMPNRRRERTLHQVPSFFLAAENNLFLPLTREHARLEKRKRMLACVEGVAKLDFLRQYGADWDANKINASNGNFKTCALQMSYCWVARICLWIARLYNWIHFLLKYARQSIDARRKSIHASQSLSLRFHRAIKCKIDWLFSGTL